ncbi:MAG: YjbQ family protein [Caldiserica bacterium]|nr:MAG: YjbQ family protein [Caldisericota bacterium]
MKIFKDKIEFSTKRELDIVDITDKVRERVSISGIKEGIINIFVPGATGAITTIEYEPGLISDFKEILKELIPERESWKHNLSHSDMNAHSHLRASIIGPSLTVPVEDGRPVLGIWQQIVFVELDVRARRRRLEIRIIGE